MSEHSNNNSGQSGRRPLISGRWHLQLLGGLRARNGDHEFDFPSQAVTLLLARLALQPLSVHSRSDLEYVLDEDKSRSPKQRRKQLNNALTILRGRLSLLGAPPALLNEGHGVRLNAEVFEIDVDCFRDCVLRRDAVGARSWYRGELLPGYRQEWIEVARDKLAEWHDGIDDWDDENALSSDDDDHRKAPSPATSIAPLPPDGLFGREDELERLHQLLAEWRLITVTGPPGCGKSHLARALRHRIRARRLVVMAPLADLHDPQAICDALRAAVPLPACGTKAHRQLATALAGKRALLVLDDAEHLVGAAVDVQINQLLEALPDAQLLITSRRALRRVDEIELALQPLPLPAEEANLETAAANSAVAMFLHCARTVQARFHLHQRNLAAVITICRAVDGLPVALELLASQLQKRSVDMVAELLADRLHTLERRASRGHRNNRHASVQAVLAGSWRLLSAEERAAIQALTTFRGGWTDTQAGALIGPRSRPVLDALKGDSLMQRSQAVAGPMRWHLLRIVRDFALEQMSSSEQASARQSQREVFLQAAQALAFRFERAGTCDVPNFLHAIETALVDGRPSVAALIAVGLESHWYACGVLAHEMRLLEQVADAAAEPAQAMRSKLLVSIAQAHAVAGRREAAVKAAGLAKIAAGGNVEAAAEALLAETHVLWVFDRHPAAAVTARHVAEQAHRSGWLRLQARALISLGSMVMEGERAPDRAARYFEAAERLFAQVGDRWASLLALPGRTACSLAQRSFRETIAVATAGVERAREAGNVVTQLLLLCRISLSHEGLREFEQALRIGQRQVRLARQHGLGYHLVYGAWNQCRPLARMRMPVQALRLLAFTCEMCRQDQMPLDTADQQYVRRVRRLAAAQLGAGQVEIHWREGEGLTLTDGIALASGELTRIDTLNPGQSTPQSSFTLQKKQRLSTHPDDGQIITRSS